MIYINKQTGKRYSGGSITISHNGVLFSGVPSVEQLTEWGYEEYVPPTPPEPTEEELKLRRIREIERELRSMDYLTSKELDGEDMTKYNEQYGGDYKEYRRNLRAEYNRLEEELAKQANGNLQG